MDRKVRGPTHPGREVESDGVRTDPGQQHQGVVPDGSLYIHSAKLDQFKSDTTLALKEKPDQTTRGRTYIAGRPVPPEREAPPSTVDGRVVEFIGRADGRLGRP